MRNLLLASVAAMALGSTAQAAQIAAGSVLNIVGNANFTATAVTFTNPANLVLGSGNFAALGICTGCVTMTTPLHYSPPTFGQVYTATNNGLTTAFNVNSLVSHSGIDLTTLDLIYTGTATLTGFDPTPGMWTLTVNQFGNLMGSFSASTVATPTPEPTTLAILGTGLLGLGFLVRRR